MSEDWQDKLEAQKRHEQLAAVVRIAVGELCYLAEQQNDLPLVERIYGITAFLETQLKDGDVTYAPVDAEPSRAR
jgi:hypothetical protein